MVQSLGVDASNDVYLSADGNIALLSGVEAVRDACKTVAQAQLGEMVFATKNGLPTMQTIWIGTPKVALYESYLRTALESVEGVVAVKELKYTLDGGVFAYTATLETIYGSLYLAQGQ